MILEETTFSIEEQEQYPFCPLSYYKDVTQSFTRTPDKVVCTSDLTQDLEEAVAEHSFIVVKSAMRTNKTSALSSVCRKLDPTNTVLATANLRSLVADVSTRLELLGYENGFVEEDLRRCTTLDSLGKIEPNFLKELDYFIWDECSAGLEHLLLSETLSKEGRRKSAKSAMATTIKNTKTIIGVDADIDDISIDLLEEIRGEKAYVILNTYKPLEGRKATVIEGTRTALPDIMQCLENGKRLYIASDTKDFVKKVEAGIEERFPDLRIFVIHRDNSSTKESVEAKKNLTKYIRDNNIDVVLHSPSIQNGVSVDLPGYFDEVILVAKGGILDHESLLQMPHRYRDFRIPLSVYINRYSGNREEDWEKIFKSYIDKANATATYLCGDREVLDGYIYRYDYKSAGFAFDDVDTAYLKTDARKQAKKNRSLNHLYEYICIVLEHSGYDVNYVDETEDLSDEAKKFCAEIGKKVKDEGMNGIIYAPDLTEEEYKILRGSYIKSVEDNYAIEKFEILRSLGVDSDVLDEDLIRFYTSNKVPKIKMIEHLLDPKMALDSDRRDFTKKTDINNLGNASLISNTLNKIDFLLLWNEINRAYEKKDDISENVLNTVGSKIRMHYKSLDKYLGLKIKLKDKRTADGRTSNISLCKKVLSFFGIVLKSKKETVEGKTLYTFTPDRENLFMIRYVLLCRAERRKKKALLAEQQCETSKTPLSGKVESSSSNRMWDELPLFSHSEESTVAVSFPPEPLTGCFDYSEEFAEQTEVSFIGDIDITSYDYSPNLDECPPDFFEDCPEFDGPPDDFYTEEYIASLQEIHQLD